MNETGQEQTPGSMAEEDPYIFGVSDECQAFYDCVRSAEPEITAEMRIIADGIGAELTGLENSVKTGTSVLEKLERKMTKAEAMGRPMSDLEMIRNVSDLIRYTFICDGKSLAVLVNAAAKILEEKGFFVYETDNKWIHPSAKTGYRAVHMGVASKTGELIEIQFHTKESAEARAECRKLYLRIRESSDEMTNEEKETLLSEAKAIFESLETPRNIQDVKEVSIDPTEVLEGIEIRLNPLAGNPDDDEEPEISEKDLFSADAMAEELEKVRNADS